MRRLCAVLLAGALVALTGGTFMSGAASADAGHVVTIDDGSVAEGSGGALGVATVTLHVDPAPAAGERVKVDFGTSAQAAQGATAKSTAAGDITPEFPEDFAQTDGTVTFDALETSKSVVVPVLGDNADEPDETFYVLLFNPRGECIVPGTCTTSAAVGDPNATVTITDDDATPTLLITDVEHDEGDTGTTSYAFTVTKTGANGKAVTVQYATQDDTATAPGDYTSKSGTLTFDPSDSLLPQTQEIVVDAKGDGGFEPDEDFKVVLSNAANAAISDAEGLATITNDDPAPLPTVSAADAAGAEGDAVDHVVSLSQPPGPGQTATIDWALVPAEGGATQGTDYTAASGSVVYTAGETEQTISALTLEDIVDELDEGFGLKLTKPVTAGTGGYDYTLADDAASGTITDDDDAPAFSVDDVDVLLEGASGATSTAIFTVTKTGATDRTSTVHYAVADGTASTGSDYDGSSGELSFAPDDVTKQVAVVVKGDDLDEMDETFEVALTAPTNATITGAPGVGTITDDDDVAASFSIGDVSLTEGNSGTTKAVFTVTKSGLTGRTTSVGFATANGSAKASTDYTTKTGSLSFGPLETSKTISVPVHGDLLDELTETYIVNLSNATDANIADAQATGTIVDNDAAPKIAIGNDSEVESSSKACTALVKLSAPSGRNVTFNYTTVSGTAGTADYVTRSGSSTFVAGDDAVQIKVFLKADSKDEPTETFSIKLSGIAPSGAASFSDATGTCSIIDND